MTLHLIGWIVYGVAAALYVVFLYGLVWSHRTKTRKLQRQIRRAIDTHTVGVEERIARKWWSRDDIRQQAYQAALHITAERAKHTHPERVAEMFSVRVPDISLLKEVV